MFTSIDILKCGVWVKKRSQVGEAFVYNISPLGTQKPAPQGSSVRRMMDKEYKHKVSLVDKNEGIEYSDAFGTYSFNVAQVKKNWIVYIPPVVNGKPHELTNEEKERITPRIIEYLSYIKWFGLFGSRYSVTFERETKFDIQAYLSQQEANGWNISRSPKGTITAIPPAPKGIIGRIVRAIFS